MNTQACPHCGKPVLPRAEPDQDVPRTSGITKLAEAQITDKAKTVRWVAVIQVLDFYPEGAC